MDSEVAQLSNEIQAIYPANSLQQGFIFHAVTHPLDDAYIVQSLFDYHHEINVHAYQQAWICAINTYPTLRLCFNWDESPIQIITKHGQLNFVFHDVSLEADKNAAILKIQHADRQKQFDLTKPTLLRLHLIKQNNNHYTLLKTEHHCIADAWSAAILVNQVHHFYQQLLSDITPTITQDTAYLQAQSFIAKNQTHAQDHWKKMVEAIHQPNDLNGLFTQQANPEQLSIVSDPKETNIELDTHHYDRLKNSAQDEGITLHGLLQFAWHKILHTYTQDAQTIVGTTTSGRALPIIDIEKSVGLYINTLPLIVQWDNTHTVKEQLHHIHDAIMGLNQYSFVYLSTLQPQGNRLFNSLLLFENISMSAPKSVSDDLTCVNRRSIQKLNYPITLTAHIKNNTLSLNLKYDGAFLNDQGADQLLKRVLFILQQIPCRLHAPHHTLDLLMSTEQQQIIHDWNATHIDYPRDQTLQDLFEKQVMRTPQAIALVFEEQHLTYSQLNSKANQLAHWLHTKGLKQGALVTLCLDRSLEMLIGILGVLKAGCAYVPIDPAYPLDRINYVLKDTESRFLLTQSHYATLFESSLTCVVLDQHPYQHASSTPLVIPRTPTDLAYVIYTSGTTGNPKGVAITHAGAVNRIDWMQRTYPLNEHDTVLQKTPYGFDVSVWELLWANWTGAKIVMAHPNGHKDPQYLQTLIEKEKVTVLHFVPSMLSAFTEALHSFKTHAPNSLRYVFCSGEALFANQIAAFYEVSNDAVAVHNLYGPTEASIDVTAFSCDRGIAHVYIGRPIQNTRVYVLTPHLKPVPVGAVGELYLGGAGLAREYWHQPALTAAAFVHNPFATQEDIAYGYTKLYKTGDRVRWCMDGNIDYLGRMDFQVKIRGFRIELSEIEQVMLSCPEVVQAVALVKEQTHRFIAAYYIGSATEQNVRAHLEKHLPDYMLPTSLMMLNHFPVTRNGKLDRNALPLPDFMQETTDEIALPRNALEEKLCAIWKNVLKVKNVKITDNFFELGGDSIRSIRLIANMQEIGFHVSVNDIFKHKTILQLIEHSDYTAATAQDNYIPFSLMEEDTSSQSDSEVRIKKNHVTRPKRKRATKITLPRNALEKDLCTIWQDVLDINNIGIEDNFFELGGDSILSIRLLAKMQEIGFSVSVNDIFTHKTILQLIENTNHTASIAQETYTSFSMIDTTNHKIKDAQDIYPASYLQMGMLIESLKAEAQGTYHDVFAYKIHRPFNETLLLDIFKALTVKHALLRCAFAAHADYGYVCVQYADIDIVSHYGGIIEKNIQPFIQMEKNRVLDLHQPGLFRLFVLNPTQDEFILIFSFHHAITDGWSVAALIAEFTKAYVDEKTMLEAEIIPPYQRVIQQERLALTSSVYETFWRDYLADTPLPARHLVFHPNALVEKHLDRGLILEDAISEAVLSAAKRLGVSPDCIFLSAYFKTLSRFCNQRDVIIGLVMNNRLEEMGGDKVFGLHLNTLPLRMTIVDNSAALTTQLFEQKTRMDMYKAYPYGKIRTDIMKARDAYTCAFNYIHFHVADAVMDSKKLSAMQLFEKTTIPLTLHIARHHDHFKINMKALNGFIDHETAADFLAYLQHDLHAIIHDLEFSFLSVDHAVFFQHQDTTMPFVPVKNQHKIELEPRNDLEKALCAIWESVLTVEHVKITDNFFELGGDSIQSIRLLAKMQDIGIHVSVGDIFKYKTIMALLENTKQDTVQTTLSYSPFSLIDDTTRQFFALDNITIEDTYPASHLQMKMLTESLKENANGTYHDVFAYKVHRDFDETKLLSVFKALSEKHAVLRTAFEKQADYGYVCLQYADTDIKMHYSSTHHDDVATFIQTEKNRVIDIHKPSSLFSVIALNPSADQFVLVLSFHHAIADGWSIASLMSEFIAAYTDQKSIATHNVPLYQRVIQQEQLALTSDTHKTFWHDYLADSVPIHNSDTQHQPVEVSCVLDNQKSTSILSTAKRLGVSADIVFLSSYFKALSQHFNQDIMIGLFMNNRLEEAGGDTVFGLHLNILPLRMPTDKNDDDAFILALADERLRLVPHKSYPYDKLLLDLNAPAGFYNCAFNYTHFHINENQTKDKRITPVYAFEKMSIPFILQVLRYQDAFSLMIRTSHEFIDEKNAKKLLDFIAQKTK